MIMSSSSTSLPHVSVLLSSLLATEKEPTRVWLRDEMDRTVDQMLHSIFQRLTNKLVNADWVREGTDGDWAQVNPSDHVETDNHKIHQPSTSCFNPETFPQHSTGYEPENDPEILAQVKREINEEEYEVALKNVMDSAQLTNEQIENCDEDEEKYQVNHNFEPEISENFDDYEICENENIEKDDENDDGNYYDEEEVENDDMDIYSNNSDGIEENGYDESSRSLENAPIETTPSHSFIHSLVIVRQPSRHAKRKQPDEEQPNELNNRDKQKDTEDDITPSVKRPRPSRPTTLSSTKQIITHTLQCLQVGCQLMFASDKLLNAHMLDSHSVHLYRCLVKNCTKSYTNSHLLGDHLAQSHQSTSEWHCDKCDHHFPSYRQLSRHNNQLHQFGQYQCSFLSCTFTAEYKGKVYDHYTNQHRQTVNCDQSGCQYRTSKASNLKRHQRAHLRIKPFRCKWPSCDYSATQRVHTIQHIRRKHLKGKSSSSVSLDDYVEVNKIMNALMLLNNPDGCDDASEEEQEAGDDGNGQGIDF